MTAAPAAGQFATGTAIALRLGGWWVVVVAALVRCVVSLEPFPHWAIDPASVVLPTTGLTPAAAMSIDAVMLLGCGIAMLGHVMAGGSVLWLPVLLWALGSIGVAVNALAIRAGTVDDARIGSAWCAAMGAGVCAMHVCSDARVRRVTLAALFGIVGVLVAKGAVQTFHEHPMTVARYRANREQFLVSQGWLPDSAAARNFERRLNQPDATGWFGLSNVYATFAAACLTGMLGAAILAWREARVARRMPDGWAGVLTLGALAGVAALWLADSKGGVAAAGVGVVLLAMMAAVYRRGLAERVSRPLAGGVAIGILIAVLIGVVARGLMGESIGERSLLFRWFYMQGAARAFLDSPLFGTGPDGFKEAYMLFKPPLSPEEVTSPHSVLLDLAARLGVFGVLWAGLWVRWVFGVGAALFQPQHTEVGSDRREVWLVSLAAAAPVLISTYIERSMGDPEQAAARLGGLAAWVGISLAMLALLRVSRVAVGVLGVGALVVAVHGQVEVTPVFDSSAAWVCVLLGAVSAPRRSESGGSAGGRGLLATAVLVAASIVVAWFGVVPASRWESSLADAAASMRPMAQIRTVLTEERDPAHIESTMAELARMTGLPPPRSEAEFQTAMARLAHWCASEAMPHLERAVREAPGHLGTREAMVRVLMEGAGTAEVAGRPDVKEPSMKRALMHARELVQRRPSASTWGLVANVEVTFWRATGDSSHLDAAVEAWERGARLDPYGLSMPLQQFRAMVSAGRPVGELARKLLQLDALQRLDPIRGLSPADRAVVERAAEGR
ncbi:MAG: O-antigen ligase family protein [Phycisphaeraceae bacterium]|nr:O-antigen ligase family protein [Phycisphaeraceae bacterium]